MTIVAYGYGKSPGGPGAGTTVVLSELEIDLVDDILIELEDSLIVAELDDIIEAIVEPRESEAEIE